MRLFAAAPVLLAGVLVGCSVAGAGGPDEGLTFDLSRARDPSDLETREEALPPPQPGVVAASLRFRSLEWASGEARPIWLHAFVVRPADPPGAPITRRPTVIVAHGLGARAELQVAVDLARTHGATVMAISAPGLGESEGKAVTFDDARALYDAGGDRRRSWIYAYTYGLMRLVTLAAQRPDVAPTGIVLAGTSMGAVASLLVNAFDDRLAGVLAASVSGDWPGSVAARSWLARLLEAATGKPPGDPQVRRYFSAFDPLTHAGRQRAPVYLFSGAQDEFFPLPQLVRTWKALRVRGKHLAIVPDWDHQWYFAGGCPARCMPGAPADLDRLMAVGGSTPRKCPAGDVCPRSCPPTAVWPYCGKHASYDRSEDVISRWGLLLRALLDQHARRRHADEPPRAPPLLPVVERRGNEIRVRVTGPQPRVVRLAISDNRGYTYSQYALARGEDGLYRHRHPGLARDALLLAEVESQEGIVGSSAPDLPPGFQLVLRPFHSDRNPQSVPKAPPSQ